MKSRFFPNAVCFLALAAAHARGNETLWSGNTEISEDANSYTVRIHARDASALDVRLTGNTLAITSPNLVGGARHSQRIDLPLAARNAAPRITPGAGELTVGVPKRAPGSPAATPEPNLADVTNMARQLLDASGLLGEQGQDSANAIRGKVLDQMAVMSRQMDQLADDPAAGGDLFSAVLSQFAPKTAADSATSFDLQELPDRFLLTAAIPEEQAKNISVNVDNDRFVTITTRREAASAAPGVLAGESSTSTQAMPLPSAVQGDRLAMDYKDGKVVISLPKK